MYDPPGYLWAMTIVGIIAILAATCVVLYGGAMRAGCTPGCPTPGASPPTSPP